MCVAQVVVSTGVDRLMRVWDMDTRKLLWQLDVGCGVAQLVLHRDAGACCVLMSPSLLAGPPVHLATCAL